MNYLVLDLEMWGVSGLYSHRYKYKHEIIQIGGVLLGEDYEPIATICQYVQPKYGVLDHFISQMTGITNDRWTDYQKTFDNRYDFDRSVGLADALELCEIEPDGHFHDGLDDAINTAKIIKKLEEKDLGENAVWIRNF